MKTKSKVYNKTFNIKIYLILSALKQLRDNLMNRLQDIQKDKKRNMTEEIASSNISGLKPQLEFSKENLVSYLLIFSHNNFSRT